MISALISAFVVAVSPLPAKVQFACTSPSGYAFYGQDKSPRWQLDGIKNGRFLITFDDDRTADISVIDVSGTRKSLRAEGATIAPIFSQRTHDFPALLVVYPNDGIVETYAVSFDQGVFRLHWTTVRDGRFSGQPTKTAAYSAICKKV